MTIPELVAEVLAMLRDQLYGDRTVSEYFRDEKHLKKAIARYGYACAQRGWEFDVPFIRQQLIEVVLVVKRQQVSGWLPVYLEQAIDQHVREHAEELNAKAKAIRTISEKNLGKLQVAPAVAPAPTPIELLSMLHQDIKRAQKVRQASKVKPRAKQGELL